MQTSSGEKLTTTSSQNLRTNRRGEWLKAAPLFRDGDLVRWIPLSDEIETHTGAVIGRFKAYAQHQGQWAWKYLVWLGDSAGRVVADTAWEEDLQLLAQGEQAL